MSTIFRPFGALIIHNTRRSKDCFRSGLRLFSQKSDDETELLKQFKAKIKATGPISVAEYMKGVLVNPSHGYYMHRDVFGAQGDFITSPEISQMFGELIGIWIVHEWMVLGSPPKIQVVELGPGRGTLADDILRVFCQFKGINDAVSLHLVEMSPKLSEMQEEKLTGGMVTQGRKEGELEELDHFEPDEIPPYKRATSKTGVEISWHQSIKDVPRGLSCFVAHEFFDALPVHKFQKTDRGWREILIDIDETDSPHHLRFVLAPGPTPTSSIYIQENEQRDHVEVCAEGGVVVQEIAQRLLSDDGSALIIDYGHNSEKTDTLRSFKNHLHHNVLATPGNADITADVDFTYLRKAAGNEVAAYGPITQDFFLNNMGIDVRLQLLLKNATEEQQKTLQSGYKMLMDPNQMGEKFKFFSLLPKNFPRTTMQPDSQDVFPTGFYGIASS